MYYVISKINETSFEIASYEDDCKRIKTDSNVDWERVINVTQGDFYVDTSFDDPDYADVPKAEHNHTQERTRK